MMDALLRTLAVLSVAAWCLGDGSVATTTDHGKVELSGGSFSQIDGEFYSTAAYTYLDSGFKNGGTGHGFIMMRISLRMPRLHPGQEHIVAEGAFFQSDVVSLCREKGYIENAELTVRRHEDVYCFSGDVVAITAPCETTGRVLAVRSTATVEICAVENPEVLSYYDETFFDLFPERRDWDQDLTKQNSRDERP